MQNGTHNSDDHVTVALAEMEKNTGETLKKALSRAAGLEKQLEQEKSERAQEKNYLKKRRGSGQSLHFFLSQTYNLGVRVLRSKKTASQSLPGEALAVQLKNCVNMHEESTSHCKAVYRLGNRFNHHKYGVRINSREFHRTRNYDAMERQRVNHHGGDQVYMNNPAVRRSQ